MHAEDTDLPETLNNAQSIIYRLLKKHPEYTIRDLVRESALSDRYVRKILAELKASGHLTREGSNKTGHWAVHPVGDLECGA